MEKLLINDGQCDIGITLGCALRYALMRHTYVTTSVSNFIENNFHLLHYVDLTNMRRDIECAIIDDETMHDMDKKVFLRLHDEIIIELKLRNHGKEL